MKVQCERCREIVPLSDFTPTAQGIAIRCPECREAYFVPAPTPPTSTADEPSGEDGGEAGAEAFSCPKCGRSQAPREACRFCGLVFELWEPGRSGPAETDEEAHELWQAVEGAWDDDDAHDRFIDHCAASGQLAFAARCYRDRLTRHPDDAMGLRKQAKVVSVAEATLLTREHDEAPVPNRRALLGVVLVVFAGAAAYFTSPLWRWW